MKHEYECIKGGTDSLDGGDGHYTREEKRQFIKRKARQFRRGTESITCDLGLLPTHLLFQVHYIFWVFGGLPIAKFCILY